MQIYLLFWNVNFPIHFQVTERSGQNLFYIPSFQKPQSREICQGIRFSVKRSKYSGNSTVANRYAYFLNSISIKTLTNFNFTRGAIGWFIWTGLLVVCRLNQTSSPVVPNFTDQGCREVLGQRAISYIKDWDTPKGEQPWGQRLKTTTLA